MRLCDIKPVNPIFIAERPKLVRRARCHTFKPEDGCWDCGNNIFRYLCQNLRQALLSVRKVPGDQPLNNLIKVLHRKMLTPLVGLIR